MIEELEWRLCDEEMPPVKTRETEQELILCEDYSGHISIMHLPSPNGRWWTDAGGVVRVDGNSLYPQYKHPFYAWAHLARPCRRK